MLGTVTKICNHSFVGRLIKANSIVFDLGCNQGEFAHAMIRKFHCRVIAAEPVTELCEKIQFHPLLELMPVAIGGKDQPVSISLYSGRCASTLGPAVASEQSISQAAEMITLRELCSRASVKAIDLVKCDIEGAEIDLFNSCSDEELRSITQMTVEFHDFLYPEQRQSVLQIFSRMRGIGFWIIPFSLGNGDVLFLNRKAEVSSEEVVYMKSVVKYGTGIGRRMRRAFAKRLADRNAGPAS